VNEALRKKTYSCSQPGWRSNASAVRLPALIAAGSACALLTAPVMALELGDIKVDSSLGQPLRASISFALNPNEQISSHCIFVSSGTANDALPSVSSTSSNVVDNRIVLRGSVALREPMMSLQLTVDCPYTPHLRRDFLLMLDPAVSSVNGPIVNAERERPAPAATTDERVTAILPHRAERAIRARTAVRHDLAANSYYRVRPGDSLSSIAARIDNRNVGLWAAVNALFRANPAAFVNNDIDQLKAGVTLAIPAVLGASGPVESIATAYEAPGSDIPAQTHASSVQGAALAPVQADVSLDSGSSSGGNSAAPDTAGPATAAPHPATDTNSPFVDAIPGKQFDAGASGTVAAANGKEYANTRPEKRIEPTTAPPVPIVGNQVGADTVSGKGSLNWLLWLGGS
jgi:pilus assembly protein FimV